MGLDQKRIVVIQNRQSGLFLATKDAWTPEVGEAWRFEMGIDAYEFACDQHLFDCDIVIKPSDTMPDIRVPVYQVD